MNPPHREALSPRHSVSILYRIVLWERKKPSKAVCVGEFVIGYRDATTATERKPSLEGRFDALAG